MKSTSAFEGVLGASPAVAALGVSVLFAVPGAPGCTIAGAERAGAAFCRDGAAEAKRTTDPKVRQTR
jgi:hypothetical protein